MDSFNTNTAADSNYIAFEMLEEKDSDLDVIRSGETLLDQLH